MEEINLNLGKPNLNVVDSNDSGTIKINLESPKKSILGLFIIYLKIV